MNPLGEQVACLTRDLNHQSKTSEGEKTQRRRRKKILGDGLELKKNRLTVQQVAFLEKCFGTERKLESGRKIRLASELGLDPKQVAVWFQNRRARWKSKKIEEECVKLKKIHESVMLEKCQLEAEVTNLKRQLSEVEKDIRKLSQASDGAPEGGETGNSTSPSFSMDPYHPFIEEYTFGEFESFSYTAEPNYINVFDWGGFI